MAAPFRREHPPIPGYEPVRELGRNGGIIYLAHHVESGQEVVLKVAWPGAAYDAESLRTRDALLLHLDHPNILRVFEVGEVEGHVYSAAESVNGGTLADRLRGGPLQAPEAVHLTRTLALAIDYGRSHGLIHFALSPSSILLTRENVPKLFDFRLAQGLQALEPREMALALGRQPAFAAPEDLMGDDILSAPAAVYRVGAVMYTMLTGQPPFSGDMADVVSAVVERPPRPPRGLNPGVTRYVEAACMKCLEKVPVRRYASPRDLADDLRTL